MESTPKGEKRKAPEGGGESKSKRIMKTPSQLESLEKAYAVAMYPSESVRAELSKNLGLSDRQLQMWFCHRRLKDRKVAAVKRASKDMQVEINATGSAVNELMVAEPGLDSDSGSDSSPFRQNESRAIVAWSSSSSRDDILVVKKCYEPGSVSGLRAIAFVEAQLGEPVREDGPILGMEFDTLPSDAFCEPEEMMVQQKESGQLYDCEIYEQHGAKAIKAAANDFDERHFHHKKPSVGREKYERVAPSHLNDSSADGRTSGDSSLSTGRPYLQGIKRMTTGCGFQDQASSSLSSQKGGQDNGEYDSVPHKKSFTNDDPNVELENRFVSSSRKVFHAEDVPLVERKRKSEEARLAREIEAHEKRIRKELEKQDVLRRKREELMRREMERHDRERRKEEERLMREKLREEERIQREQKRELERRERFVQKENLRAEKMRQKEELRREKEAARRKAANERATARKIIKESMELIEDERLELMELAASTKGLPSIISLDSDTLQNLELFRDLLSSFPPKSVQLKRPFSVRPWTDSEENVGNLLMAWSSLITFADVLALWPFTLDEFVQAFHDYDPRLLGEIHIALLRSIIKDIEDVARTPTIGLGAANPGGGHPQIVEGAYAWGFDIRSWKRHLNPLTWPEILRQFALSAGFGPQLKKRSIEWTCFHDNNEDRVSEDIISTLRNGAAAENAVATMQVKGFSHSRRAKNRLTPGTVKFAAFHVLSLEGSKGLTVLEVADKIQKSGLRDLTTSKTPEASISAALSRDANLFERTAPSTYCVRPAFRKNPADAEAILSAARGKLQVFESGFLDYEEAEKDAEDVDDVERDEDSECDVAEDPEVGVGTAASQNEKTFCTNEEKSPQAIACPGNGKCETLCNKVGETPRCGRRNAEKGLSFLLDRSKEADSSGATIDKSTDVAGKWAGNPDQKDMAIDESSSGEPWVQGLMEGEYSDLSVEERLNALVALIGVAMEGNSVRVILEERVEAANALKKQMWAEAQLDKRRMKDEHVKKFQHSSFTGIKSERNIMNIIAEGGQSQHIVDNKNELINPAVKQEALIYHNAQSDLGNLPTERNLSGQEFCAGLDSFPQHHGYAAEILRSQLKSYIGRKAEEMYAYRSIPLGQDRRRNRYWQFITSVSRNDPGSGRIFFESHDGCWRLIDSEEAFDTLLASLDNRGIRESHLHLMLQKIAASFKETIRRNLCCSNTVDPSGGNVKTEDAGIASSLDYTEIESPSSTVCVLNSDSLDQSSSFRLELGKTETEKIGVLKRYKDFQRWMWKECLNSSILFAIKHGKKRCSGPLVTCDFCHDSYISEEKHCLVCHRNFETFHKDSNFANYAIQCQEKQVGPGCDVHGSYFCLPLRVRLLKAQLALIEVSVPPEALDSPFWTEDYRKAWGMKLHTSSSAEELLQLLTSLEGAIKRACLSSDFEMTKELLDSSLLSAPAVHDSFSALPWSVPVLPWVPQTTAAVALRLMELDASISYFPQQKVECHNDKEPDEFIKLPSRYSVVKTLPAEALEQAEEYPQDNQHDPGNNHSRYVHRRGGRGWGQGRSRSGGGCLGRVNGSRPESAKVNASNSEKMNQVSRRKTLTHKRECNRGRRSVGNRQRSRKNMFKDTSLDHFGDTGIPKHNSCEESPRSLGGEEWEDEEIGRVHVERSDNSNSADTLESDDTDQATEYKYDDREADLASMFNGRSEDLMEESHDDEDGNGDMYVYMDEEGNRDGGEDTSSSSSDYSD